MSVNEDEISNVNTEDGLLPDETSPRYVRNKWKSSGPVVFLFFGTVFFAWGLSTMVWTPFHIFMEERLRMSPGLPPYDWWKNPPDEVLFRVYIFNVTNSEEFLNNSDTKLNMAEIGPLVFMEKLTHTNVTFNENGTMTYVATRKAVFLPDRNNLDLNSTIIVPNWALLGIASYLSEESFFVKLGFNLLTRAIKPSAFVAITIDQLLWNFTDPMLDAAQQIAPFLVPMRNLGILSRIYTNFVNTVNVFIGSKHGHHRFFLIDKYDGSENLPNYGDDCSDKVVNSTEGITYPQFIDKTTRLLYWRKTLCKNAILGYHSDVTTYGVNAFRFLLPATTFNRTEPDCYRSDPPLPDGLSDIAKCHFGFPLATSFPHFLYGDETLRAYVTGLQPNETKHESFLIVEPTTGVPIHSKARSQSNLVVRKLEGFNSLVTRFSDIAIPMFWIEYNQVGLPWYIAALMYFTVNVLPIFQWFFTAFLLVSGTTLFCLYGKRKRKQRLLRNKVMVFEDRLFIPKPT